MDFLNTAKRLPIVFCLDISPSMGWRVGGNSSSIELLNVAVNNFISEIKRDPKARAAAEIAFVTFSTEIKTQINFTPVRLLKKVKFETVKEGGTRMADAVIWSIDEIEKKRQQYQRSDIPYFAPFLVLVTDGNPDDNDDKERLEEAVSLVRKHCDSHVGASEVVVPFIVGVGDRVDEKTLKDFSAGFVDGYFPIKGIAEQAQSRFQEVFKLIGNSAHISVHLNRQKIIPAIMAQMRDSLDDIVGEC